MLCHQKWGDYFYRREVTNHRAKKAASQMASDDSISVYFHRKIDFICAA